MDKRKKKKERNGRIWLVNMHIIKAIAGEHGENGGENVAFVEETRRPKVWTHGTNPTASRATYNMPRFRGELYETSFLASQ